MPATRSRTRTYLKSRPGPPRKSSEELEEEGSNIDLQSYLSKVKRGISKLETEVSSLRSQNERLRTDLAELEDESIQPKRGKRGGPSTNDLQRQVRKLEHEVERFRMAREEDKRRIRKLEAKEVRAEAQDLQDVDREDSEDETHQFRKLLREVEDLVTSNSYEEDEACPICFEALQTEKCQSLTCDHIFCDDCLGNMTSGKSSVVCPTCRKECNTEDFQPIRFSAGKQWDSLLAVAERFASVDTKRGELDTTDEEVEEDLAANFVVDDDETTRTGSEAEPDQPSDSMPDGLECTVTASPHSPEQAEPEPGSYYQSPTSVKRKRLEELAQQRKRRM